MIEFNLITTPAHADDLSNQLEMLGARAVTMQDAADQPIYEPKPDEHIVWNEIVLSAFFMEKTEIAPVSAYLTEQLTAKHIKSFDYRETNAEDWEKTTQEQFIPLHFGNRLWICPSWCVAPDPHAVNVTFNAGLAFGTGSHDTTALCLEWLDANIKGGEIIIDYGCGSGILAVSALKLGAKHAVAVDYDPQALEATRMNAELNEFSEGALEVCLPEMLSDKQADVVVANIIAETLIELAPILISLVKPGGTIILSGVQAAQATAVCKAYAPRVMLVQAAQSGDWVRLDGMTFF